MLRTAFLGGLRKALRVRLLLPIYLLGLVLGLVQAWPLVVAGVQGGLTNPYLDQLTAGNTDTLASLFMANPDAIFYGGVWSITLVLLTFVFAVCYNGFAGGLLSVWSSTRPFAQGFGTFFMAFSGLGILLIVLAVLAVVVAALLGGIIGGVGTAVLAAVLLQLINVIGEYSRALAVIHDRRNPFVLLGMGIGFCVRHPGALLLALAGVALHGAWFVLLFAATRALGGSPLTIVVQQVLVLGWLWIKALRLGWALSYVQATGPNQAWQATPTWGAASPSAG